MIKIHKTSAGQTSQQAYLLINSALQQSARAMIARQTFINNHSSNREPPAEIIEFFLCTKSTAASFLPCMIQRCIKHGRKHKTRQQQGSQKSSGNS